MDVQQRRARRVHRVDQRLLDAVAVVETFGFPQVDDQVRARKGQTVAGDEVILVLLLVGGRGSEFHGFRGSLDARHLCFFGRRNKCEISHFGHLPS